MVLEKKHHRAANNIKRFLLKKEHFYGAYFLSVIGILAHNGV